MTHRERYVDLLERAVRDFFEELLGSAVETERDVPNAPEDYWGLLDEDTVIGA